MRNGSLKYFLLALIFGLLAALGSYIFLNGNKTESALVEMKSIPVAKENIEAYSKLDASHFEMKAFPSEAIHPETLMDIETLSQMYASTNLRKGEPILRARVREDIDDILPSVIKENHRAISVLSSEFQAVGDMIRPGDYVDLVVFLPEKMRKEEVIREDQANIFVQNIKVLAVSRVTLPEGKAHEEVPDRYSVTLEVPMEESEKIVLAENIGVIEIILRRENDKSKRSVSPVFWEDLR
ncbi:Flp pilus assembly protein CpaB [Fusibacter sp. JL216-2]|uniref:Flp pilus assembly protein CpaB n=1 Tax=Fusibacter sp. JL216-2 TaxID=3071453 RepID=UPI003D352544